MQKITIAIDAMGGDHGLSVTVPACVKVINQIPNLHLIMVGDQSMLETLLAAQGNFDHSRISIHHASQQVGMDEPPSSALRNKKDSSMRVAINLVKQQEAQACVSAGNTGALMATARFVLKTIPGIDRPAIVARLPARDRQQHNIRMLDLGANVDSNADHLYQFAVMGSVLAACVDEIQSPRVGLLNIGEEEIKGNDLVKRAAHLLSESPYINYQGFIEGDKIFLGEVDVIVCDGFVGNVALKTLEGAAKLIGNFTRDAFNENIFTRLAALVAMPVLKRLRKRIDPSRYNGASLLGLQGIVIKSHGGADIPAFANAVMEAVEEVDKNVIGKISEDIGNLLEGMSEE